MKCPHCGEEISKVIVNSTCFQTGMLKEYFPGVWGIEDHLPDITVEDTIDMQCPECMEIISGLRDDLWTLSFSELTRLAHQPQQESQQDEEEGGEPL